MALGEAFFLGAFAKLRIPVTFVVSACPSAWNNSVLTLTDFYEIWYLVIFRNTFEKIPSVIKLRQPVYCCDSVSLNSQNESIFRQKLCGRKNTYVQ